MLERKRDSMESSSSSISGRKRKVDDTKQQASGSAAAASDMKKQEGGCRKTALTDLTTRLFGSNHDLGLEIRSSPAGGDSNNYGVYATRDLAPNDVIAAIPASAVLDPDVILKYHPLARMSIEEAGVSQSFAFWLALASMARDVDKDTDSSTSDPDTMRRSKGGTSINKFSGKFDEYLASLPREAPDPCAWSEDERELLSGTPLAKQVDNQLRLLREEYERVAAAFSKQPRNDTTHTDSGTANLDIPFDIDGRGIFPSLLWARGMHLSRSFPRSLLDAANLSSQDAMNTEAKEDTSSRPILSVRLGFLAPNISYSGPRDVVPPISDTSTNANPPDENRIAGTLGILLPFLDLLDHKCGHSIQWEADHIDGQIRFRCLEAVRKGDELVNNYGPKGNQELLFTYGFAVRDNPLDSVDGIVIGCKCPQEGDGDDDTRALHEARVQLLEDHDIPHKIKDGALLIGPFDLHGKLPSANCNGKDDDQSGVIPAELLCALSVIGMETIEEGPSLSLDEIEMLKQVLSGRLEKLMTGNDKNAHINECSRSELCTIYKEGQCQLLRKALAELDAMMQVEDDDE